MDTMVRSIFLKDVTMARRHFLAGSAALAMGDSAPAPVDYVPPTAPDPLQRAARSGSPDGVMR